LYSIGVVLFEMLTARAPFEGDSAVAIALKHVNQPPPPPRELRPDIPPQLEAVVLKALAKEAADRYSDADTFIRDLEHARAARPAGVGRLQGRHRSPPRPVSGRQRLPGGSERRLEGRQGLDRHPLRLERADDRKSARRARTRRAGRAQTAEAREPSPGQRARE